MTTKQIKDAIIVALQNENITPTATNIAAVYHCFMETGCGLEVDIEDAMKMWCS